ncbi:MAG: DUF1501 domain-containing protein [Microthrixaceae bacterium]|nr:DUF1501 domain-containing protein [Microthrixaceae bacterium]
MRFEMTEVSQLEMTTTQFDSSVQRGGMSRRRFLAMTGSGGAAVVAVSALGHQYAFATPGDPAQGDVLVVVFNRGGMDGLNVVAPYRMPTYQALRPTIRVKPPEELPGSADGAGLPLDSGGAVAPFSLSGVFGLNPGMTSLHAGPWSNGHLAVVHAAGMPASESATRSHFEAQRNWEAGSARLDVTDGFLNRHLEAFSDLSGVSAIGRGSTLQAMLRGTAPAFAMSSISSFGLRGFHDNKSAATALSTMYPSTGDLLSTVGADTLSVTSLVSGIPDPGPQNGATYTWDGLAQGLRETARLIRANVGLRAVVLDDGGWDSHTGMGSPEDTDSSFRNRTAEFSDALTAFYTDLGAAMDEVTVVTVSEFGRTINENSSGGTDHGRATAMFVMGRNVNGGVSVTSHPRSPTVRRGTWSSPTTSDGS